jgi:hypothetical protein
LPDDRTGNPALATVAEIKQIELVKGKDASAPIVMAVTVETP